MVAWTESVELFNIKERYFAIYTAKFTRVCVCVCARACVRACDMAFVHLLLVACFSF